MPEQGKTVFTSAPQQGAGQRMVYVEGQPAHAPAVPPCGMVSRDSRLRLHQDRH